MTDSGITHNSTEKTTILIADDHTLVREIWTLILNSDQRFTVVAECGSGEEAIELSKQLQPHVVIMDINLPGMNGIDATENILRYSPFSSVLGVSLHTQPAYARKMMQKGAMGYVTKNSSKEEMFTAITEIMAGRKYICNEIKTILSDHMLVGDETQDALKSLSNREKEIITYIRKGLSSKEIADALYISSKTVEVHRYNILRKLNLKNSAALVNFIGTNQMAD